MWCTLHNQFFHPTIQIHHNAGMRFLKKETTFQHFGFFFYFIVQFWFKYRKNANIGRGSQQFKDLSKQLLINRMCTLQANIKGNGKIMDFDDTWQVDQIMDGVDNGNYFWLGMTLWLS